MHFLLATVSLLAFASRVASQCRDDPARNCRINRLAGFCTSARFSLADKRSRCGFTCGLCNRRLSGSPLVLSAGGDGSAELLSLETQTSARGGRSGGRCVDANANCASFAATRNFCTRPDISTARKLRVCCATCRPIILATTSTTATPASATTEAASPTPFTLTAESTTESISSSTSS